ncbi:hypothetical protein KEM48_003112 [Puccinia striiformis f. sp. tritici PST-130]|uniref:Uncharacterized protein n=1 Tax=Puccinia striiformis f. sp. tritici PST-78 TaxID=1165861 RepID=A0A0L0URF5_9BASI|nr:hypothetical protein KEM48_003112 [Puccinia striiformis f. sp. tritici PST-130]KNE89658.1 hypothetical protein PSTG_16885 [Puccinia striiformis f. sp. tritici PST-78]
MSSSGSSTNTSSKIGNNILKLTKRRRIENLRTIRLGTDSRPSSGEVHAEYESSYYDSYEHDSDCLRSLLVAAQGLKCFDIYRVDRLSDICDSDSSSLQLANITQLDLPAHDLGLTHPIINLAIALKSSLQMLTISNHNHNCQRLLPIFENLSDTLQGLSIAHSRILGPITHLKFPALRVLRVVKWDGCISDLLSMTIFSYSPIEVIALSGYELMNHSEPAFHVDPFARLTKLRRLVFSSNLLDFSAPANYLKACQDHQVK